MPRNSKMIRLLLVMLCAAGAFGKTCSNVAPGLNRQARGVDVTKLDLMPLDPLHAEDGYKYPVISYTCDEGKKQTIDGTSYDVPDQVFIISEIPSGSLSTRITIAKTSEDVKKTMTTNAGLGLNIGKFGFSASTTFSRTQRSLSNHDKKVAMMSAYFGGRRVDLQLRSRLDLGIDAQDELARLPVNYMDDPSAYEHFIQLFGTHYIAEAKYGGLVLMHSETSNDYLENHNEQTLEAQASASFLQILSLRGVHTTTTTRVDTSFTSKTTNFIHYYGGSANLLTTNGLLEWQPTISARPWLFSTRLNPITYLVRDTARKAQLDVAVTDYILRSYLTIELPRVVRALPGLTQSQTRARTLLSKISTMANKRPLIESEVATLGQEVESEYKAIFLDFYRNDDGFRRVNDFDQPFTFECPPGKTITRIESVHNNRDEDRQWSFGCSYVPGMGVLTNCAWTDYVNNFDEAFTFSCPNNGVLKGWSSYHENRHEDRRHRFKCCEVEGAATQSCLFTDYVNNFDQPVAYRVAYSSEVITGVGSYHNNRDEDRRFRFQRCSLHFY